MRPKGSAVELENRRRLAVQAYQAGRSAADVAAIFEVHAETVRKWSRCQRKHGAAGLSRRPATGRHRKLTPEQEAEVLTWFSRSALEFGFTTDLWTAPRVCELIRKKWKIRFHARYLNQWLAQRGITPQKPERRARERDEVRIAHWRTHEWPGIQKKH